MTGTDSRKIGLIYSTDPFWSQAALAACKALASQVPVIPLPVNEASRRSEISRAAKSATEQKVSSTLVFVPDPDLLPSSATRYLIFTDATLTQRYWIEARRPPGRRLKARTSRVRALTKAGHRFACFSRFAAHGVAEEYRTPIDRIHIVPYPIDLPIPSKTSPSTTRKVLLATNNADEQGRAVAQELSKSTLADFTTLAYDGCPYLSEFGKQVSRSDLVILTSSREPYPLAAIAALADAKPVFLNNVGAAEEIVEDGVDGFVLDRATDAAREALAAPGRILSQDRSARAAKVRAAHSLEAFRSQVLGIL